jgi:hypothetical protein
MKKLFLFAIAALTTASMFAADITCADAKAKIDASDKGEYTVVGYVTEVVDAASPIYKNITFWMADEANGGKVFEVYRLSFKDKPAADIPVVGDQVAVTATLKKFTPSGKDPIYETDKISGYEIRTKGAGERYTDDDMVLEVINVARAIELTEALGDPAVGEEILSKRFYEVHGYHSGNMNKGDWDEKYKNQSFYLTDEIGVKMGFGFYRASTPVAIEEGAYVACKGQLRLNKYQSGSETKLGMQMMNGTAEVIPEPQAINNVNAENAKAVKVIENGQLYIIRNGVKFNAAGAVVK